MDTTTALRIAAAVLALACALPTHAGQPAADYARVVVIVPREGQVAAFEQGYARHLQWHRRQADPWTWHGWSFVLGERLGQFMDGTFGHAAGDFDAAVDPAGDAADNAANVAPHADFASHAIYGRLATPGGDDALPDDSPYMAMTTYFVRPGREVDFEAAIARCVADDPGRHAWLRLARGGDAPQYLLLRPVRTFGSAATLPQFFRRAGAHGQQDCGIDGIVERIRDELLRHRPALSHVPGTADDPS